MLLLLILIPIGLLGAALLVDALLDPDAEKGQWRWPALLIAMSATVGAGRLLSDRFSETGRAVFAVIVLVVAVAVVREYRRIP